MKNYYAKYVVLALVFVVSALAGSAEVKPGDDLQAVLNKGEDLVLKQGLVYEISNTLRYKKPGQKIYTKDARFPSEYATLRLVNKEEVTLVNAYAVERAVLEHVICDGNRYNLSVRPYPESGKVHQPGILNFGGGEGQVVRECVFMNARGFSNIVLHKGAGKHLIENNLVLGAGVDARGNGRAMKETPRRWSDGISCGAPNSMIRNNLVIDPTDVGIVLYCAPGSVVENNVVASISRESLGGVNLVDAFDHYAINDEKTLFDYRGSTVRDNYIDAFGARIHIGIPVGCVPWVAHWRGKILTGGEVSGNTIAGGAGGYGFVAHGITDWKITGNKSIATYSGLAEYGDHKNPPDDPAAFLYDAATVENSELQPEFVKSQRHIEHLLRTHHAPQDELGYQMHDYGDAEIKAVVEAAYLEMLGRSASKVEMAESIKLLRSRKLNADGLRRRMMISDEFKNRFGDVPPEQLHPYRVKRWFDICDKLIRKNGKMPSAIKLYKEAIASLRFERSTPASVSVDLKPSGHAELDAVRRSVSSQKTNKENYKLRIFLLKQWVCTLQQMGANTESFLNVSETFRRIFPWNLFALHGKEKVLSPKEEKQIYPAIDEGYRILEKIYAECNQLTEAPVLNAEQTPSADSTALAKPKNLFGLFKTKSRPEDWPLYQKNNQHTGYAETDHTLAGKEAWRFPVGLAWESQPVVEDDIVYAVSPGMRTIMYSLDLNTGQELWSTKQLPAIVTDQLYWTPCAASTPRIQDDEIIVRDLGSRGNKGDTRYAVVIDKKTGKIKRRVETGHVDYRAGYAPIAADKKNIVFPHGTQDIHEDPPVCRPFNRLICRDAESGKKMWDKPVGPTLCEPVIKGNTVVTGTMNGNVFCFELEYGGEKIWPGNVRWQFNASGGVNKSPCIDNGKVIFGSNDGQVYCLSEKDGKVIWTFKTKAPEKRAMKNFSAPVCVNGKVYIGSADTFLYCLNEQDGRLEWKYKCTDWLRSRPVVSGNKVFISTIDGKLLCLKNNGNSAELLWERKCGTHQSLADLTFSNNKILVTTADLFLWCYNEDGNLLWKKSLLECAYDGEHRINLEQIAGGGYFQSKVTAADGKIFFGTPSRFVYAVEADSGKELWKFELGAAISVAPSYSNGKIFAGQQGGEEYFYCIDAQTGQKIWQQSIGWVWGSCNIAEGKVLIPCIDGYATCLDEKTGAIIWRYRTNASLCTEPTIDGDTVFFGGWDRFINAFDIHTGEIKWNRYYNNGSDSGSQIAHNGKLYFPSPGSKFRCLNAETGKIEWDIQIDKTIFNVTPALHNNRIFAPAMIGRCLGGISVGCNVYCFDIETRQIVWTHPGGGHTAPVVAGGRVYFGSLTSPYIYCVDEKGNGDGTTQCFWKFRMDNRIEESCPAFYDNKLYLLSSGGWVYAVQ